MCFPKYSSEIGQSVLSRYCKWGIGDPGCDVTAGKIATLTNSISDVCPQLGSARNGYKNQTPHLWLLANVSLTRQWSFSYHNMFLLYMCGGGIYILFFLFAVIHSITIQPIQQRAFCVSVIADALRDQIHKVPGLRELVKSEGGDGSQTRSHRHKCIIISHDKCWEGK